MMRRYMQKRNKRAYCLYHSWVPVLREKRKNHLQLQKNSKKDTTRFDIIGAPAAAASQETERKPFPVLSS